MKFTLEAQALDRHINHEYHKLLELYGKDDLFNLGFNYYKFALIQDDIYNLFEHGEIKEWEKKYLRRRITDCLCSILNLVHGGENNA